MLVSLSISIGVSFPMIAYSSSTLEDLNEIKYLKSVYDISIHKPGTGGEIGHGSSERPIEIFEDIFSAENIRKSLRCNITTPHFIYILWSQTPKA